MWSYVSSQKLCCLMKTKKKQNKKLPSQTCWCSFRVILLRVQTFFESPLPDLSVRLSVKNVSKKLLIRFFIFDMMVGVFDMIFFVKNWQPFFGQKRTKMALKEGLSYFFDKNCHLSFPSEDMWQKMKWKQNHLIFSDLAYPYF